MTIDKVIAAAETSARVGVRMMLVGRIELKAVGWLDCWIGCRIGWRNEGQNEVERRTRERKRALGKRKLVAVLAD